MKRWCIKYSLGAVLLMSVMVGAALLIYLAVGRPGRIMVDCRGYQVDVNVMKRWEKEERNGYLGLTNMAGWRVENRGAVSAVDTGKSQKTQVIGVWGPMDMVYPADILSGSYGLAVEDGYCVLSGELAFDLFGGTDAAGERISMEGRILTVAGVIDKKGDYLLHPVTEGPFEQLALQFKNSYKMRDKAQELLDGIG